MGPLAQTHALSSHMSRGIAWLRRTCTTRRRLQRVVLDCNVSHTTKGNSTENGNQTGRPTCLCTPGAQPPESARPCQRNKTNGTTCAFLYASRGKMTIYLE